MADTENSGVLDAIPDKAVYPLTQAAFDRLQAEYIELTTEKKIDIARKIEAARELGDLSENGDYHAAKEEQGKMAGRISAIHAQLENARIIQKGEPHVVRAGKVVGVLFEGDSTPDTYLIGSIEERSDDYEVVSPTSAMGKALAGKKAGESATYEAPTGAMLNVQVTSIEDLDG